MNKYPKTALVVQGRFHAFALGRALLEMGVPVTILTNYPAFIATRFGLPKSCLRTAPHIGLLHREAYRMDIPRRFPTMERFLHQIFSKWAGKVLENENVDLVHSFTGVAYDMMKHLRGQPRPPLLFLARGSSHIVDQYHLLKAEEKRAGSFVDKPTTWMIGRERREYQLADNVITLSSFAQRTFLKRGYSEYEVPILPLAANTEMFRSARGIIEDRCRRLLSNEPLQVLGTGSFCLRKGALDFVAAARELHGIMKFTWVGNITPDVETIAKSAAAWINFIPRVAESDLPRFYASADLYFFPTIEDGFAVTLAQAKAACLPILATKNCAAPELVLPGVNGWLVDIRDTSSMVQHLRDAHADRYATVAMVEHCWSEPKSRDWGDVAADFIQIAKNRKDRIWLA